MTTEHRRSTYRIAPGVLHRVVADDVFVLMATGRVHWLKRPSARALWQALVDGGATVDGLAELLVARFEVAHDAAARDAAAFVETLLREGVLTVD